jgi:thiamine biosynthesis lipoprotein
MTESSPRPKGRAPVPPRRLIAPAIFVGALFLGVLLYRPAIPATQAAWTLSGATMGTTYHVKVAWRDEAPAVEEASVAATLRGCLDEVDARMSTYRADSELSRFNAHSALTPVPASAPLLAVVAEAQRVSALSDGAFDVTVGPLVDAWGFGPATRSPSPPSPEVIAGLRAYVGHEKLHIDPGDPASAALRKDHPSLRVDLSAIAKGYAVDLCADRLDALGLKDYMIEVGGEVRVRGLNPKGDPWRIGIERPGADPAQPVQRVISLPNLALATSGDYRNYYEHDGQRLSHTIDPRTGAPITHRLASVSVLAPLCMTADALATALNVLGPDAGFDLAQRHHIPALFLIRTDHGFDERASDAFNALYPPQSP